MKNPLFPLFFLLTLVYSCNKTDPPPCSLDLGNGDCLLDFEEMLVEKDINDLGDTTTLTYDSESRLIQRSNPYSLRTYDYPMPDQVLSCRMTPIDTFDQWVYTLQNGLTAQSVITSWIDGSVTTIKYDRNPDGSVKKVSFIDGNNQLKWYDEYEYDTEGNVSMEGL